MKYVMFLFPMIMTLLVSCDFNKKGADERTNVAQALPEVMDAQKISESAGLISEQDQEFKILMNTSELKLRSLKSWAIKTQRQLQNLIDNQSKRLSSAAKIEILNNLEHLNTLIAKLNERSEEMVLPSDIQSGIRLLIQKSNTKIDYRSIGSFVLQFLRLDELKAEGEVLLSGQTDINLGDLQSWDHEIHYINNSLYREYSAVLSPNLKEQMHNLMSKAEDLHEVIKIFEQKNQTIILASDIKTFKHVLERGDDVKVFMRESEHFENIEKEFKDIFLAPSFNLLDLVGWSQTSISDIELFLDHWREVLAPEKVAMASYFHDQLTRVLPSLKFAYEKEIPMDPQLVSAIRASLAKQDKVNWEEIFALIQATYGSEIYLPGNLESLPIEHGFYIVGDEKIAVTTNVIRKFAIFSRTENFEKELGATLDFNMREILLQAEEIQSMTGIKKMIEGQTLLMSLNRTKLKIKSLPDEKKVSLFRDFHTYQVDLRTMQEMPELESTQRLQVALQGERCLSFFLLEQKEEATAESCPLQ